MTTYDDHNIDERADNDTEILELLEEERKWRVILKFKDFISKEPEFVAIDNLSSQTILNIIQKTSARKNKKDYPEWHITFLEDLINELGFITVDINFVKNVYENIYNELYI